MHQLFILTMMLSYCLASSNTYFLTGITKEFKDLAFSGLLAVAACRGKACELNFLPFLPALILILYIFSNFDS
jgi:hypothetical protein